MTEVRSKCYRTLEERLRDTIAELIIMDPFKLITVAALEDAKAVLKPV